MQYRISDLIDLPGFQQVMQAWYSVAGVATALLDIDRTSLCTVGWAEVCARFHHLSPQAERRCTLSDDALFNHLQADVYEEHPCVHGLMNCAMPVMVKGEHLATLLGVQNAESLSMGKGSIACLEITDLRPGHAQLRWFLRQKQLRLLA